MITHDLKSKFSADILNKGPSQTSQLDSERQTSKKKHMLNEMDLSLSLDDIIIVSKDEKNDVMDSESSILTCDIPK